MKGVLRDGTTRLPDDFQLSYVHRAERICGLGKTDSSGAPPVFYDTCCHGSGRSFGMVRVKNGVARATLLQGMYELQHRLRSVTGRSHQDHDRSWYGFGDTLDFLHDSSMLRQSFVIEPNKETVVRFVEPALSAITVTVRDPNGKPVRDVSIAALRWDGTRQNYPGNLGGPSTDSNGRALFDPLVPGTYVFQPHLTTSHFGPEWRYAASLQAGKHHQLEMALLPRDRAEGERDRQKASVTGLVLMPDAKTPAAYAAVHVDSPDGHVRSSEKRPETFTDSAGRFMVDDLPLGRVMIYVRGDGTALAARALEVSEGKNWEVRVVLDQGATVSGCVVADHGASLSGLSVAAVRYPKQWFFTTPLRLDGRFTLYGVGGGQQFVCLYRHNRLQPNGVLSLTLRPGERRDGIVFAAERMCKRLDIHVRRADGRSLPSFSQVHLFNDFGYVRELYLGDGPPRVEDIAPGRYHAWVQPFPSSASTGSAISAAVIKRDIMITSSEEPQRIDIVVPNGGGVTGRVVLPDGRTPARAARVAVHVPRTGDREPEWPPCPWLRSRKRVSSYAYTVVAPDGSFELLGLLPGRYAVEVQYGRDITPCAISPAVTVRAGELADVGTLRLK